MAVDAKHVMVAFVVVAASFAFGRYTAPETIKYEKQKTQTVDTKTDSKSVRNQNRTIKTTTIVKPDGSKVIERTEVSGTISVRDSNTIGAERTDTTTKKEIVVSKQSTSVFALGAVSFSNGSNSVGWGLGISRPVIGPISIGVFGLSLGVAGASVGLTF